MDGEREYIAKEECLAGVFAVEWLDDDGYEWAQVG